MPSIEVYGSSTYGSHDKIWHKGKNTSSNTVMEGVATLTANASGGVISGSVTGAYTKMINSGWYNYPITVNVLVNGSIAASVTTKVSLNGRGKIAYLNGPTFSISYDSAKTIQVEYVCGQTGGCTQLTFRPLVGSIYFGDPDTPPTNITGGRVYNQNGVVNGDDKLDWDFYVDWWGESAGTHTISHYNLDIYNAANLNRRVAVVENVKKFTRYNFESLLPKCKVGETYAFYVNALIDNSYWLGKVYIGSIKLYKDGIVWVKNYSNGSKVEATMAYNKYYTNGSKKKSRYILVKDISGAKRIIDMYTTHYE